MSAYYNEIDPYAAQWLRNLIKAGHIAPGDVDERSIVDVSPDDLKGYTQCHFFAGIGVWSHGLRKAGWDDERPVWTGSCPCQPFSSAGKGNGFDDERHLWPEFHRLIKECNPSVVFGEQVASKDGLAWFDLVQTDMEETDYAFAAVDLCAAGVGAPHIRQRLWWVADADDKRLEGHGQSGNVNVSSRWKNAQRYSSANCLVNKVVKLCPANSFWRNADWLYCRDGKWRGVESGTFPLAHGASSRVGRLRAYGNAIVAPLAQVFIESYMEARY